MPCIEHHMFKGPLVMPKAYYTSAHCILPHSNLETKQGIAPKFLFQRHVIVKSAGELNSGYWGKWLPPSFSSSPSQWSFSLLRFQRTRWDDFNFYINSHCSFVEKYFLFSATALFTYLASNATESSILLAASNADFKPSNLLKWRKR